jgi:antitoxin component of RelBE/YafQ-DinJ toxin-antitoxin module
MKARQSGQSTFTFRVDQTLKKTFMAVTEKENKPVAEVLRKFMADYIERKKKKEFEAEARRQSALIAASPEEAQVMDWIKDVADREAWK